MRFHHRVPAFVGLLLLATLSLGCAASHAAPKTYDFEDLAFGKLAGQDHWKEIKGTPVEGPGLIAVGTETELNAPDGPNTSKVLQSFSGLSRINDAKWGYTVSAKETSWVFQFDYKREGPYLSLAYDANGDGTITTDEAVGWIHMGAGMAIHANSKPGGNPEYVYSDPYPNLKGVFEGDAGTWLRGRLIFNWADQSPGVYGTVTAQVKNLRTNSPWERVMWPNGVTKLPLTRKTWGDWLANASAHPERAGVVVCTHHNRVYYQMDNIVIGAMPDAASLKETPTTQAAAKK
ncbi:MAG: hypothetical protein NTW19_03615 [Planctomycetota bacterium]|nr:hypothetical protein [Planctomycetota bacterium]